MGKDPSHVDWLKLLIGSFVGAVFRAGIALNCPEYSLAGIRQVTLIYPTWDR